MAVAEDELNHDDVYPLMGAIALHAHRAGTSFASVANDIAAHLETLRLVIADFQAVACADVVDILAAHGVPDASLDVVWSGVGGPQALRRGPRPGSQTACTRRQAELASTFIHETIYGVDMEALDGWDLTDARALFDHDEQTAERFVGAPISFVLAAMRDAGVDGRAVRRVWDIGFDRYDAAGASPGDVVDPRVCSPAAAAVAAELVAGDPARFTGVAVGNVLSELWSRGVAQDSINDFWRVVTA